MPPERVHAEYNLALGERRAQAVKNVPRRIGDFRAQDLDNQLRQGAPGGRRSSEEFLCPKPRLYRRHLSMSRLRAGKKLEMRRRGDGTHGSCSRCRRAPFFALKGL